MDKKIRTIIRKEKKRQKEQLNMIPSENMASAEVMKAVGSVLMNKYAEGYPKKRYYQGNPNVDCLEALAKKRVLEAFGVKDSYGVNVQPYSGSPANLAVYNALLDIGDTIMGMYLPDGGHLSHGWHLPNRKINITSKIFKPVFYHVSKKSLRFDYDRIETQAKNVKPKIIISGGTAYPRDINHKRLGEIAKKVGAYYMADIAHEAGLVAAQVLGSPFGYADVVTFTTHKTFRGPRAGVIMAKKNLMEKINFSIFPGLQGGPHMHTIAGIAVAGKEMQTKSFKKYAQQVVKNAKVLAKELKKYGFKVVSGGTDKHLVLVDLRNFNLSGWIAAWALEAINIIANRNTVPYDTALPYYPSGLRMGTPILTTRGMKEKEMVKIADWIDQVVKHVKDEKLPKDKKQRNAFAKEFKKRVFKDKKLLVLGKEVKKFARKFPVPGV